MRIAHGPAYRVYSIRRGAVTYLLLCGGDKFSQTRDIQRAKAMAAKLEGDCRMRFTPFDVSEFLDSAEAIAEYLAVALADPDPELFIAAPGDVAKARGMAQIAREAGLGRESLPRP